MQLDCTSIEFPPQAAPHPGSSPMQRAMARSILIVAGVALLSSAGFGVVLAIGWLVFHLVLGTSLYLLTARTHSMLPVLWALAALVAFVGAGCAACFLSPRRKDRSSGNGHPAR